MQSKPQRRFSSHSETQQEKASHAETDLKYTWFQNGTVSLTTHVGKPKLTFELVNTYEQLYSKAQK